MCSFGAKTNRVWEFETIQIKIKVLYALIVKSKKVCDFILQCI